MRLFIALELDEEMKKALLETIEEWKTQGVSGRFTPESRLHLTLAFLGEKDDPEAIMSIMKQVPFPGLDLQLEGVGFFGSLCYGAVEKDPTLMDYAARLRQALKEAGIAFDAKAFRPHITLIRNCRLPQGLDLQLPALCSPAAGVVLYESRTENGCLSYIPLCKI